jgi:uncharacterized membrane protein
MTESPSRRLAWLSGLLFISLAVNCLFLGALIGRELPWPEAAPTVPQLRRAPVEGFGARIMALPLPERHRFFAAMRPFRPGTQAARADLAEARRNLRAVLMREPYDPAAVTIALAEVRRRTGILQQRVQDAAAQALAALSPQSRRWLAEAPARQQAQP